MIRTFIEILALLVAVNGAPVLATYFLGARASRPVDGGWQLADGRPLLGNSKTWRGFIIALCVSCVLVLLLGYGLQFGLIFGALVMAGDLASSFIKRRRGLVSSDPSRGLDQLPESFLPSLYATFHLEIAWWWSLLWAAAFMLVEILISLPLFLLHIRKRPY
jgi:CDP-2,3-bis-(O-geranylgeranyl)-sn-glycerol synthase